MSTLLDTNILTRSAQPHHPMHRAAVDAVDTLRRQGEQLVLVPQNFYEFWVVGTRPIGENGLGMTPSQLQGELGQLRTLFTLFEDTPAILPEWERVVTQQQVKGKNAHDARLVAAMLVHRIGRILTFNAHDFQRFPGIVAISPDQLLAASAQGSPTA